MKTWHHSLTATADEMPSSKARRTASASRPHIGRTRRLVRFLKADIAHGVVTSLMRHERSLLLHQWAAIEAFALQYFSLPTSAARRETIDLSVKFIFGNSGDFECAEYWTGPARCARTGPRSYEKPNPRVFSSTPATDILLEDGSRIGMHAQQLDLGQTPAC